MQTKQDVMAILNAVCEIRYPCPLQYHLVKKMIKTLFAVDGRYFQPESIKYDAFVLKHLGDEFSLPPALGLNQGQLINLNILPFVRQQHILEFAFYAALSVKYVYFGVAKVLKVTHRLSLLIN